MGLSVDLERDLEQEDISPMPGSREHGHREGNGVQASPDMGRQALGYDSRGVGT